MSPLTTSIDGSPSCSSSPPIGPPLHVVPLPPPAQISNTHPMVTRAKDGIFHPKVWVASCSSDLAKCEPNKVFDALASPL